MPTPEVVVSPSVAPVAVVALPADVLGSLVVAAVSSVVAAVVVVVVVGVVSPLSPALSLESEPCEGDSLAPAEVVRPAVDELLSELVPELQPPVGPSIPRTNMGVRTLRIGGT